MKSKLQAFPPGVASKLKTYVYRLIDPRNGETFYVGRGQGDRVFQHIQEQVDGDELGTSSSGFWKSTMPASKWHTSSIDMGWTTRQPSR
jgi:hypothetical protein